LDMAKEFYVATGMADMETGANKYSLAVCDGRHMGRMSIA